MGCVVGTGKGIIGVGTRSASEDWGPGWGEYGLGGLESGFGDGCGLEEFDRLGSWFGGVFEIRGWIGSVVVVLV